MQGGEHGRLWMQKDSICRHICKCVRITVQCAANKRRPDTSTGKGFTRAMPTRSFTVLKQSARARAAAWSQGVGVDLGFPAQRGRGENSQVAALAPISPTRLRSKTAGPDFNFSHENSGALQ